MVTVRIFERPEQEEFRWAIEWNDGTKTYERTASEALQAVKARDNKKVEDGAKIAMTQIEWEPKSKVGRAVVSVIANSR